MDLNGPSADDRGEFTFRGGCTLLIDPESCRVRYAINKHILSASRLDAQRRYLSGEDTTLRATYFGDPLRGGGPGRAVRAASPLRRGEGAVAMARMNAPESGVAVRMYRAGLGDCFLLAFRGRDDEPVYMLIDCGVHSQVKGGSKRIRDIAKHIRASTDGHLNVVTVTHEHGDHVSGFYLARDTFEQMTIDEAWLAWTEDPDNKLAKKLDRARSFMLRGLRLAGPRLTAAGDPAAENVNQLLGFFDLPDVGFGVSTREARDAIRDLATDRRYLKPKGRPLTLSGVDGVRIFVLGPPEDEKALMRARPSSKDHEVYEEEEDHAVRFGLDDALSAAFFAASGENLEPSDYAAVQACQPFAGNYRVAADIVKACEGLHPFFHKSYGFDPEDMDAWRRIDPDWQRPAESLALKLDSATNNTSLVLAIELQASGRVLLFAADAQVGNWQSWHEGGWSDVNGLARGETLTAEDLLHRTVLYKVGHHGSHNATLRKKGLEMMTSPDLTAMIPVEKDWAYERRPYPWKMPFGPLYDELLRRTEGRILRSDIGHVDPKPTTTAWREFEKRCHIDKLFVEVHIPDV